MTVTTPLDDTYLQEFMTRLKVMLYLCTGKRALDYVDDRPGPYWFMYWRSVNTQKIDSDTVAVSAQAGLVYILGKATEGISGEKQRQMSVDLARSLNYLMLHPRLTYRVSTPTAETDENGTAYVDVMQAMRYWRGPLATALIDRGNPFGQVDGAVKVGFTLVAAGVWHLPAVITEV